MRREERGVREAVGAALIRGSVFVDAACSGQWRLWALGEAQLHGRPRRGTDEFVRAMEQVCQVCPLATRLQCEQWARTERYTGYAAGSTWVEGEVGLEIPLTRATTGRRGASGEAAAC